MKHLLDSFGITYHAIPLSAADAPSPAAMAVPPRAGQLVQPLLVRIDHHPALVLLRAGAELDPVAVGREADAVTVVPVTSHCFADLFPGCEPGAMPPLGGLCGIDAYADEALAHCREVAFYNGTRAELLAMRWADLARLVDPLVGRFARPGCHSAERPGPA